MEAKIKKELRENSNSGESEKKKFKRQYTEGKKILRTCNEYPQR